VVLRGPVVPRTDRDRAFVTVHTLLLHLRPVKVPARTIRFTHTFGLGGSSLVLIGMLAVTGILLMLAYQPATGIAYDSILTIENEVLFGPLVRGVHYWSANLLVVVLLLHAGRAFLTGGYHGPRQFNWVVGVVLLGIVLANAFTGYLLPWDQLSYWAVTISTGMLGYVPVLGGALQRMARGGAEIGADTLILFYTVHTSIVPALLAVLTAFHFWRVRKAGGVVMPPPGPGEPEAGESEKVMLLPHLLMREVAVALVVTAVVVVLGAALGAPLGQPANPGMSQGAVVFPGRPGTARALPPGGRDRRHSARGGDRLAAAALRDIG
jgi:quinol-cytochrome oxidoreductase complex cytochrome b subunit